MDTYTYNISDAIIHYNQTLKYGVKQSDKHMDGFLHLFKQEFERKNMDVKEKHKATVKGGILNKRWDLVASNNKLKCAIEFKSILSSRFGKHYSSRVEEAIGVGVDAKAKNKKTKLGYLIILQNDDQKASKHHSKIHNFCYTIVHQYKIYNSAIAIEVNNDKWEYLFNDYKSFMSKFNHKNLFDILKWTSSKIVRLKNDG